MKKSLLYFAIVFLSVLAVTSNQRIAAIPNPWVDCGDDISCGAQKAGFNFPLLVKNYSVRAMEDMMEIKFPIDKKRNVMIRKSIYYTGKTDDNGIGDNSGVYENYPVNKTISLKNGVMLNVRGNKNKFYVVNFAAETGYYSLYSKDGMTLKDINNLYNLIREAETTGNNVEGNTSYSIEELKELRTVKGKFKPVYTKGSVPNVLEKRGVTKDCFERANLGQDSACSESQIKMIKAYYKGQK